MAIRYAVKKYPYYMYIKGGDTPHWARILRKNKYLENKKQKQFIPEPIKEPSLWKKLYQILMNFKEVA